MAVPPARLAAAALSSKGSLPGLENAAMDGSAVRNSDRTGATAEAPGELSCIGVIPAGTHPTDTVDKGTCMRIFTGSPIPQGADAVIMQEDCSSTPGNDYIIRCNDSIKPWGNIGLKGEDVSEGDTLITAGTGITAGTMGLLAATGRYRGGRGNERVRLGDVLALRF